MCRLTRNVSLDLDVPLPDFGTGAQRDDQVTGSRSLRFPQEAHTGDVMQAVALAVIAFGASAGGVRPGILAAFAAGSDMVDGEIALAEDFAFHH